MAVSVRLVVSLDLFFFPLPALIYDTGFPYKSFHDGTWKGGNALVSITWFFHNASNASKHWHLHHRINQTIRIMTADPSLFELYIFIVFETKVLNRPWQRVPGKPFHFPPFSLKSIYSELERRQLGSRWTLGAISSKRAAKQLRWGLMNTVASLDLKQLE